MLENPQKFTNELPRGQSPPLGSDLLLAERTKKLKDSLEAEKKMLTSREEDPGQGPMRRTERKRIQNGGKKLKTR
jgi:hypothetical protein